MAKSASLQIDLIGWRERASGRFSAATSEVVTDLNTEMRALSPRLVQLAREQSPVGKSADKNGEGRVRFADAWRVTENTSNGAGTSTLVLENTADIAEFVLFPTRPHRISAHARSGGKAGYLRFSGDGGAVHFARTVQHPGTKGNDVLSKVLPTITPDLTQALRSTVQKLSAAIVHAFDEA